MQISEQCSHLLVGESPCEAGHHSSADKDILPHRSISSGNSAGQVFAVKEPAQIRRDFLQSEIVVLVAVRAANLVEVLPFGLLRCQRGRVLAAGKVETQPSREPDA